jgi:hypothetical protein
MPRVDGEPDRGRPVFFGQRIGGANVWHILLDPSWLHEQAAAGLRCKRLLELLKPSDPVGHLLRPRDVLAHRPSPKSGTPPSSSARHATAAHTSAARRPASPLDARVRSAAFSTLAMSARATSSSAGAGRMASIVAATSEPRIRGAIPRADFTGLHIGTIRFT